MGTSRLRIFLNYRRDETSGHAGRLYDALAARFGEDHVFMDIDQIEPGLDFTEVINDAVASCDVVIALVGARWSASTDAKGRRRLESPDDFVRLELEAALGRGVRVIPTLVQNAEMPSSEELPETMRTFARRHAVELSDTRWTFDVGKMIGALERLERQLEERATLEQLAEAEAASEAQRAAETQRAAESQRAAEAQKAAEAEAAAEAQKAVEAERAADAEVSRQADSLPLVEVDARRGAEDAIAEAAKLPRERPARTSEIGDGITVSPSISEASRRGPERASPSRGQRGVRQFLTIEYGLCGVGAVAALVGSLAPWAKDWYEEAPGYVTAFHVAVGALTLGAIALLALFIWRRNVGFAIVATLLAAIAAVLTIVGFIKIKLSADDYNDGEIAWGIYLALVGSGCFFLTTAFVTVRRLVQMSRARPADSG